MWGSRDPLLEFWDPLIPSERLNLKTSHLTQRWMAVSLTNKCKAESKSVMWRDTLMEF